MRVERGPCPGAVSGTGGLVYVPFSVFANDQPLRMARYSSMEVRPKTVAEAAEW